MADGRDKCQLFVRYREAVLRLYEVFNYASDEYGNETVADLHSRWVCRWQKRKKRKPNRNDALDQLKQNSYTAKRWPSRALLFAIYSCFTPGFNRGHRGAEKAKHSNAQHRDTAAEWIWWPPPTDNEKCRQSNANYELDKNGTAVISSDVAPEKGVIILNIEVENRNRERDDSNRQLLSMISKRGPVWFIMEARANAAET